MNDRLKDLQKVRNCYLIVYKFYYEKFPLFYSILEILHFKIEIFRYFFL